MHLVTVRYLLSWYEKPTSDLILSFVKCLVCIFFKCGVWTNRISLKYLGTIALGFSSYLVNCSWYTLFFTNLWERWTSFHACLFSYVYWNHIMFRNSAHPHFILLCPVNRNVNVTIVRESYLCTAMFILLGKKQHLPFWNVSRIGQTGFTGINAYLNQLVHSSISHQSNRICLYGVTDMYNRKEMSVKLFHSDVLKVPVIRMRD